MTNDFFNPQDWNNIIVAIAVVAILFAGTFTVKHYQDRKEARKKIESCEFKLRDNEGARRTYMTTASEITQNKHLRRVIDSLACANDSLTDKNLQEYEKNQRLISHLMWIVNHNDSVANARVAEFDSTQNQLLREKQRCQEKLK